MKVPHTLVLLYGMIVLAWLATLVLPAGVFETVTNDHGREVVVPGTFTTLADASAPSFWSLFTVIPRGLAAAQGIIFFVFIIGGALGVIRATGALDAAMSRLLERFGGQTALLIAMGMLAFGAGSSTIGMAEEYIALIAILITLCRAMRMDTVAALGIMTAGYAVGFGTAVINPFTVLVAQEVAGLPPTSGWGYRLVLFFPFLAIGFVYVLRYARKVQADPTASLVYDIPEAQPPESPESTALTGRHWAVLGLILATLVALVWGIKWQGWYLVELGAIFIGLALVAGLVCGLGLDDMARRFVDGAAELTGTALLIGFARAIELMLSDGQVLYTIVNALAVPLEAVGGELSAVGMLLIQSALNFFIPSGSGQAYVTMPLMAPIADLVGVTRQVAVLAYQMGDGFMNIIVPTNAVLMGMLGLCGIPYGRWFRFVWPLVAMYVAAGAVAIVIAVQFGYS
ncbi:YfcC family protein [Marinihelvus fidelis]|uniref:YfcC family protein n=2 Tax=Marinihelvus fidelis TaxID=2613842 RepID=A0A5N0TJT4_9GAMM|nr:YfcC family protein [Marinihelvus fidelis]